jgi:hypothetical protein
LIESSLRMTSKTDLLEAGEMLSLSIPSTVFESLSNVPKSSVYYSPSSKSSISLNIVESLSRYEPNLTLSMSYSNPVHIHIVVNHLTGSVVTNEEYVNLTIILEYEKNHIYGNIEGTNITVTTKCNSSFTESNHTFICPSGQTIIHDCAMYPNRRLSSICSFQVLQPSCYILSENVHDSRYTVTGKSTICGVIASTSRNTTCHCSVRTERVLGRRRLEDALESSGTLTVLAMGKYTFNEFYETIMDSDELTLNDLRESYVVLVMFVVMWCFGAIFFFEEFRLTGNVFVAPKQRSRERHQRPVIGGSIVPFDETKEVRKKYLLTYLNSIFPVVFYQEGTTWQGLVHEIFKHHRYMTIFTGGGAFSYEMRVKTILQMLTVQTLLMFVLSVCYDLQYPSDTGQCHPYNNKIDCLKPASIFDPSQKNCYWKVSSSSVSSIDVEKGTCEYLKPNITLQTIVLISILVATVTAPFNLLVDFLFEVIRAPTADSNRLSALISSGNTSIQRAGRRISAVSIDATLASNILGNSLRETLLLRGKSYAKKHMKEKARDLYVPEDEEGDGKDQEPNDEKIEMNFSSICLLKRKQRSTLLLSDFPTGVNRICSEYSSMRNRNNFASISPGEMTSSISPTPSSSIEANSNHSDIYSILFSELKEDIFTQYNQLTGVDQREEFMNRWG